MGLLDAFVFRGENWSGFMGSRAVVPVASPRQKLEEAVGRRRKKKVILWVRNQ